MEPREAESGDNLCRHVKPTAQPVAPANFMYVDCYFQ